MSAFSESRFFVIDSRSELCLSSTVFSRAS
jgi:hypothetical protein